jgi:hypothetical protein
MDASCDRADVGSAAGGPRGDRMALLPSLARPRIISTPSGLGLQVAATLSHRAHRGGSGHLCGRRGSGTSRQPGDVHSRQWFHSHTSSLVSGAVRGCLAHTRLRIGLHLVVSIPNAGLGIVACRIAHPLASLGVGAVQYWRMLPANGQTGPHATAPPDIMLIKPGSSDASGPYGWRGSRGRRLS